jgi:hypothetical protein
MVVGCKVFMRAEGILRDEGSEVILVVLTSLLKTGGAA